MAYYVPGTVLCAEDTVETRLTHGTCILDGPGGAAEKRVNKYMSKVISDRGRCSEFKKKK